VDFAYQILFQTFFWSKGLIKFFTIRAITVFSVYFLLRNFGQQCLFRHHSIHILCCDQGLFAQRGLSRRRFSYYGGFLCDWLGFRWCAFIVDAHTSIPSLFLGNISIHDVEGIFTSFLDWFGHFEPFDLLIFICLAFSFHLFGHDLFYAHLAGFLETLHRRLHFVDILKASHGLNELICWLYLRFCLFYIASELRLWFPLISLRDLFLADDGRAIISSLRLRDKS